MCKSLRLCFASLLVLVVCALSAMAQSTTTGTISGSVLDQNGAVIPNASITIRNVGTGITRQLQTDDSGHFTAPLLEPGDYEVTASANGFQTGTKNGTLALNQTLAADFGLTAAGVTGTVTVTADSSLVQTSNTEVTTLVDNRSVETLPLNGRRFHDLVFLTPGVSQDAERGGIVVSGQRGINANYQIDGNDYNEPFFGGLRGGERSNSAYTVSQEAIREFQVSRSGAPPEFGRSTAGVVNVITKSGGNAWHGGAFYYLRHREFSPRNRFGEDTAPIRQQFGGDFSGPIVKNKAFFYVIYDGQKERQPLNIRFNATTGLPADLIAKQGSFISTNNINTFLGKVDYQITHNTGLTVRYNQSSNTALNGTFTGSTTGVLDNNGTEFDRTRTLTGSANTVFSSTLLNEFRAQYSSEPRPRLNNGEGPDFVNKVGPQTQISGCCFFGGVSFLPNVQVDKRYQLADNFSIVNGNHTFKVGADFNLVRETQTFRGNWRGVYIFNTLANFVNNLNKVPGAVADQFRIFFGDGAFDVTGKEFALFGQDTWKVRRNVTITGGLRWEGVWYPQPTAPNPLLPQTASIPNDTGEWQPRLGIAWDILGNSKLVARASAGLFYARTPMLLTNQAFNSNGNPNVGVSFTLNSTQIKQAQTVHPEFVYPFVPDTSKAQNSSYFTAAGIAGLKPDASFFAPDFRNPRSFNATIGLEYLLANNLVVSFDWVHINTIHLERIRDVNLFPPVIGLDNSTPPQSRPLYNVSVRPNPNFNILRQQESTARSNYDGFTVQANKRFAKHYSVLANYTIARSLDDDSNERNFAGIAYADAFNIHGLDYTYSRNDIRHKFVASGTYDLPWGLQVSGIFNARSGSPFSPFTNTDSNKDSQFTDRPIVNGVMLGRNSFRQPNFWSADMRVTKFLKFGERHKVALIFDMFNVFNHENFFYSASTNESTTTAVGSRWGTGQTPLSTFRTLFLADGTFNRAGASVSNPFQLQVAVKYTF